MKKERIEMTRKASDNKYLHKDFHITLNILLDYVDDRFGREAVIEYLSQYTRAYHRPLHDQLKAGNMSALLDYLTRIYQKEEWPVQILSGEHFIELQQYACPGMSHIKASRCLPSPCYVETYRTVYEVLCEDTPVQYHLQYFDNETGACTQLFTIKEEQQ
jgi:hypothetical protein